MPTMKNSVTFFLFCLGIAGYAACLADASPRDEVVYQANVAADGVQRVRIEGGGYFFKPERVDTANQFPVKIISRDQQGATIETVRMEALEINATLPQILFNPK